MKYPMTPRLMTVQTWTNAHNGFQNIFEDCYLEPLVPILEPMLEPSTIHLEPWLKLFVYFAEKFFNRVVIVEMYPTYEQNEEVLRSIKSTLSMRSYGLKYKYDMIVKTLPTDLQDIYHNYNIHRGYEKNITSESGTIQHSGDDLTYSNTDRKTEEYSTTGDSQNPRLKSSSRTFTEPSGSTNTDSNSIKTTHGHTITTTPGKETETFSQDSSGYYNSGSKVKMIEDALRLLNYNLLDKWLDDIISAVCLDMYYSEPRKVLLNI